MTVYDFGPEMSSAIFGLMRTEGNKLLIGTIGSGLLLFDGKRFEKISRESGLKEATILKLAGFGGKYLGSWAQMNRFRLSEFIYTPVPGTQGVFTVGPDKRLILNLEKYTYLEKDKSVTYSGIGFKTNGVAKDDQGRIMVLQLVRRNRRY